MFTHIPLFLRENFIYGCSFVRFVHVCFCCLEKHCRKEELAPQNMFKSRIEKNTEERTVDRAVKSSLRWKVSVTV